MVGTVPKLPILDGIDIVFQPYELHSSDAIPVHQAVITGQDQRDEDEDTNQKECRENV
ncbi:Uncharacterised protein [Mycobacteroides abscessus subsp. abscessus]|nr:Uncharacterised protein [Mycobacteroides abscessus subsp. abscessus]